MRLRVSVASLSVVLWLGCAHTQPGTYVELVDKGGTAVYVSGAAAPGINQKLACTGAVQRAVAAIALKFAQKNDDVADDVAKAVGVSDGEVFLQRFAKARCEQAAVQDIQFDPVEHLCMATVRWTPPVFVKDAVLEFAEELKKEELGGAPRAEAAPTPAAPAPSAPAAVPTAPPPAPVSVAPAPAAGPQVPACTSQKRDLKRVLAQSQSALNDLQECKRRTQGDAQICHRYQLYVDEAAGREKAAGQAVVDCINAALSVRVRQALADALAGYAAISMETRADGALVLWTFSPVEQTAFALDVAPDGTAASKSPLAANQVQWLRQQLGL